MIAEFGILALGLAFVLAVFAGGATLVGLVAKRQEWLLSGRNLLYAVLPLLTLACGLLVWAQWTGEYQIAYVNGVSSNVQPDTLKVTALWGGQAGSLMAYSWLLSLYSAAAVYFAWKSQRVLMPWVILVFSLTLAFFLMLSVFFENPFARTWISPTGIDSTVEKAVLQPDGKVVAYPWQTTVSSGETYTDYSTSNTIPADFGGAPILQARARFDGRGLNPLLRHPGMIIHPPMLYIGFTGFVVPFAFAMASLITKQMEASWIRVVRRWTLIAWAFLSIGLVLGGRWAYDVLGWGGYWGWDPVENSAFLPWLTGTAFLHSVMIQEKRGMLKGWNMMMIIMTYILVVLGTGATRTGLLSSVHSFAESELAIPISIFFGGTILISFGLYVWRGSQGYFEADHDIEGIFSRESIFLLNNWLFFILTLIVFWGTWAEKITDFMTMIGLRDSITTFGPEWYELSVPWLFLAIYVLMGVAPLVAWRRATPSRVVNALSIPIVLSLILGAILAIIKREYGIGVIFATTLIAFAGFATFFEIYKGVAARHRTHHENWVLATLNLFMRNRRRYGGYLIHLGVVIMGIGIIGSSVRQEVKNVTMFPGDTTEMAGYTLRYREIYVADTPESDRRMVIAPVDVYDVDGNLVANLRPRNDIFTGASPMSIAGTHSTLEGDLYVRLIFFEGNQVSFRIYHNPLIGFVWYGGVLLIIGSIMAAWPDSEPATARVKAQQRKVVAVGTGD